MYFSAVPQLLTWHMGYLQLIIISLQRCSTSIYAIRLFVLIVIGLWILHT